MTLKSSFRKPFWGLFFQSLKHTVWIPLLLFIERMWHTFSHSASDYSDYLIGFFWLNNGADVEFEIISFLCIPLGALTALILFNFAWSKKQSNVIFSLGMTRTEIYFAKLLAGVLPFIVMMTLAAGFEIFACMAVGFKLSARYLIGVLFILLTGMVPFLLSFCVSSAVMANSGNLIEGTVFSMIAALMPTAAEHLAFKLFGNYTLGAGASTYYDNLSPEWNWSSPFFDHSTVIFDDFYNYGEAVPYFAVFSKEQITIFDWSGIIMATVYSVIAVILGYIAFKKRRNEITGTFGRARGLSEICAVVIGIFAFSYFNTSFYYGEGKIWEPAVNFLCFAVAYFAFKLIFGYKRKKEFKKGLKRLPAYACGFFAVFLMFYFNGFGYSSYIPPISKIESIDIQSPMFAFLDDEIAAKTTYGLKVQNIRNEIASERIENYSLYEMLYSEIYGYDEEYDEEYEPSYFYSKTTATFKSEADIKQAIELHRALIKDGHVYSTDDDACGASIVIKYKLKSGTEITRNYFRSTEETTKKLLLLNNTEAIDQSQKLYFGSYYATDDVDNLPESFEVVDKSSDVVYNDCYLFPTDMSKGYKIGIISEEFFNILMTDIYAQSADEHYHHSAEDEVGVLAFNLSSAHGYFTEENKKLVEKLGEGYATTTWNLNITDTKSIVITKDMVNTVKYLEDNDLMKYFENDRSVDDIKHVKVATMGELYGENKKHLNIPIFYGSFAHMADTFPTDDNGIADDRYYKDDYYFGKITEIITDKTEIQALLDEAVIFGYCSNESKIMEITYTDNTIATVMIP